MLENKRFLELLYIAFSSNLFGLSNEKLVTEEAVENKTHGMQ